jgi:predicted transcriptional regulator
MKVFDLLFELANSDRLKIMFLAEKQNLKLSHISKKLDMTVAETSRHLQRLSEAKLLEKDSEGLYEITPFGKLTLSLIPSFDFISKYNDYFAAHSLSRLPYEFVCRIGNLTNCTFTNDVMIAFNDVEILIEEAQEYVWILSNQILMSTVPLLEKAAKRGVNLRFILSDDLIPPPGYKPLPAIPNKIERRDLQKVNQVIVVSEKRARLFFPFGDEKMDYAGFASTDELGHNWCRDLFMHYWADAKRVSLKTAT